MTHGMGVHLVHTKWRLESLPFTGAELGYAFSAWCPIICILNRDFSHCYGYFFFCCTRELNNNVLILLQLQLF